MAYPHWSSGIVALGLALLGGVVARLRGRQVVAAPLRRRRLAFSPSGLLLLAAVEAAE